MKTEISFRDKLEKILIEKLGIEENKLDPSANLISDLNLSEIEKSDLISFLEKELNFTIKDRTRLSEISTLEDLMRIVEENSNEF